MTKAKTKEKKGTHLDVTVDAQNVGQELELEAGALMPDLNAADTAKLRLAVVTAGAWVAASDPDFAGKGGRVRVRIYFSDKSFSISVAHAGEPQELAEKKPAPKKKAAKKPDPKPEPVAVAPETKPATAPEKFSTRYWPSRAGDSYGEGQTGAEA